jgi:hypothetical protein
MKDVMDIIPAGVSWHKFMSHIENMKSIEKAENSDTVMKVFKKFVDRFCVPSHDHKDIDKQFFLNVGASPVYMSPREYTDMIKNAVEYYDTQYDKLTERYLGIGDLKTLEAKLRSALYKTFRHSLDYTIKVKHGVIAPEFEETLKVWFEHEDIGLSHAFVKTVDSVLSLDKIIASAFEKQDGDLFEDIEFVNYINSVDPQVFKEDLVNFLVDRIKEDLEDGLKSIRHNTHKKKSVKDRVVEIEEEEVSRLEFLYREIVNAIKIHKLSNVMIEAAGDSIYEALKMIDSDLGDDLDLEDFADISTFITDRLTKIVK